MPADGWYRVEEPSWRIRALLAAMRSHAGNHRGPTAAEFLAEAWGLYWDNQEALRAARHRAAAAQKRAQLSDWSKAGTKQRYGDPTARAEEMITLGRELRRKPQFAGLGYSEIARVLRNPPYSIKLSHRRIRYILSRAGV